MSVIKELLEQTKFKKDAKEIARQLAKRGIDRLELLADAPGRLGSATIWGHPLSQVIDAIREVANTRETNLVSVRRDAPGAGDKPIQTKPFETPTSEPDKPVGGIK